MVVVINFSNNSLILEVTGTYDQGDSEVGESESFEIEEIKQTTPGDLTDLLEWAGAHGSNGRILRHIEELCLNEIRKNNN